ncbi:hypothetical protein GQ457_05G022280 [Hibiscus cannabinus]
MIPVSKACIDTACPYRYPCQEYRYSFWSTGTPLTTVIFFQIYFYRCVPVPNSCRSAFNAGLKLPNDSIDDLNNQNGWKSMKKYKNMFLKLQQQEESHPRAKNPILVNL